jgi:hypothetical protein
MGRGRRSGARAIPRNASDVKLVRPKFRRLPGAEPPWGVFAVARYAETYSDELISQEIGERFLVDVSEKQVAEYLRGASVPRRKRPRGLPFSHADVSDELTVSRRERLLAESAMRDLHGETAEAISDWLEDELARYSHAEHLCYAVDPVFTDKDVVASMIRRLKKWHRGVGRPVGGEGFEDLLAGAWRDVGIDVVLAPRSYDGADTHLSVSENLWVAMSLKSEGSTSASRRTIHLSSVAPHHEELESPQACRRAIAEAMTHLGRYDRMIYLRATEESFPGSERPAQRYTLLELPRRDIIRRLLQIKATDFAPLFLDPDAARARNSFTVPVRDSRGRKLFSVTLSRRPPRISITSIEFSYCDLIASYWTEPVIQAERLSRQEAASGRFDSRGVPRWDTFIDGARHFGRESR